MSERLELVVEPGQGGQRLDQLLAQYHDGLSRAAWQKQIRSGLVKVDNRVARPSQRVAPGEQVVAELPVSAGSRLVKPNAAIDVLYRDDDVIVINKPAGLIVHPSATDAGPSVAASFAAEVNDGDHERPGVVHRLDKDTSGVMLLARNLPAKKYLIDEFKHHRVKKTYLALIWGHLPDRTATIDLPIGRDSARRTSMKVSSAGKPARSHYQVEREYDRVSLLRVNLETGRTHQIRVHFAHLGHPVVGDRTYGRRPLPEGLKRQFLHASEISLKLPNGGKMTFSAPLPTNLQDYLDNL
jgi:23S rRNA pseudouridine1911/1915/1917 synthase